MRESDVEALLLRERRAALPLARQFLLYLDPFALFKDASKGPPRVREHALSYNRAMRWVLVPYIRRWLAIAAALFIAIAPTEALAAQAAFFIGGPRDRLLHRHHCQRADGCGLSLAWCSLGLTPGRSGNASQ